MHKPAQTSVQLHDLIQNRWSPRAFDGKPVDADAMRKLFEAARWASSRNNLQPWRFIVAGREDTNAFAKMHDCLLPGNQKWAHAAGALVIVVANTKPKTDGNPMPPLMYDTGLAVGQLVIEALANDLYVHQMGGIDRPKIKAAYNVPDHHAIICALAIGKMGDKASLSAPFDEREVAPRSRKPLSEIVFTDEWGQAVYD